MVEGEAREVSEEVLLDALKFAQVRSRNLFRYSLN
jgi:polyribonucleotide nucleotidyltransferase